MASTIKIAGPKWVHSSEGNIDIDVNGARIRVQGGVDSETLRYVLTLLQRGEGQRGLSRGWQLRGSGVDPAFKAAGAALPTVVSGGGVSAVRTTDGNMVSHQLRPMPRRRSRTRS